MLYNVCGMFAVKFGEARRAWRNVACSRRSITAHKGNGAHSDRLFHAISSDIITKQYI